MLSVAPHLVAPVPAAAGDAYVLLVDDHEPSLRRLGELLQRLGHRCISARSGAEALSCCDRRRPSVVVTDLMMPNLDGRGLARWLQPRCPSVPIILMTGQELDSRALCELQRTFAAVLPKPVDIDRLLGLLDRIAPPAATAASHLSRP
jgi:CheY-like chemotaxis protein